MKELGIKAHYIKPYTITTRDSDFSSKLENILNEQFNPTAPNAALKKHMKNSKGLVCPRQVKI